MMYSGTHLNERVLQGKTTKGIRLEYKKCSLTQVPLRLEFQRSKYKKEI